MPYSKQIWRDGQIGETPITAARLNHIEQGIADAPDEVYSKLSGVIPGHRTIRPGLRVGVVGNSIEAANQSPELWGAGWTVLVDLTSKGRWSQVVNASAAGSTMPQYVQQFNELILPRIANINTLMIGGAENDIQSRAQDGQSVAEAMLGMRADLTALVGLARSHGLRPILRTTAPHHYTSRHKYIGAWNVWVKNFGAEEGITVLDFHTHLTDFATGNYREGLSQEPLAEAMYPNASAHSTLARYTIDMTVERLLGVHLPSAASITDTGIISANPMFGNLGMDGMPVDYFVSTHPYLEKMVMMGWDPPGNTIEMRPNGTDVVTQVNGPSSGPSAIDATKVSGGDVLEWTQEIIGQGGTVSWTALLAIYAPGGDVYPGYGPIVTAGYGEYKIRRRIVVPEGCTLVQPQFLVSPGYGVVTTSAPTIRNLTREGII